MADAALRITSLDVLRQELDLELPPWKIILGPKSNFDDAANQETSIECELLHGRIQDVSELECFTESQLLRFQVSRGQVSR
jgi:hypothetical protein